MGLSAFPMMVLHRQLPSSKGPSFFLRRGNNHAKASRTGARDTLARHVARRTLPQTSAGIEKHAQGTQLFPLKSQAKIAQQTALLGLSEAREALAHKESLLRTAALSCADGLSCSFTGQAPQRRRAQGFAAVVPTGVCSSTKITLGLRRNFVRFTVQAALVFFPSERADSFSWLPILHRLLSNY